MSSRWPTTVRLSLDEFARHGGMTGPHKDGWGVAWYSEGEILVAREGCIVARIPAES
jgi:glutamine amidotransferase